MISAGGSGGARVGEKPWLRPMRMPGERVFRSLAIRTGLGALLAAIAAVLMPTPALVAVAVIAFAAACAFAGMWAGSKRSEWARLEFIEWRECPRCREPLDGLADEGACPRCGGAYDVFWLKSVWTSAYSPSAMADHRRSMEHLGLYPGLGPRRTRRPSMRRGRAVIAAWIAVLLFYAGIVWADITMGPMPRFLRLVLSNIPISIAVGITGEWSRWRKSVRPIALDFRVCTACGFDLRGLPETGCCPECRTAFTPRSLRAWWICNGRIPAKWDLTWIRDRYFEAHPEERSAAVVAPGRPASP